MTTSEQPIKSCFLVVAILICFGITALATAGWDPWGDITHPDRIIRNIGREAGNVGREVDRIRREAQIHTYAPLFETWLKQSRNTADNDRVHPIPPFIRNELKGFYRDDILNLARFKVGDQGVFNLAQLSIRYGSANAVTLINLVVFKDENHALRSPVLWAHELKHIQQFHEWGVRNFAIRYLRSWNTVEGEAYAAQNSYGAWRAKQRSQSRGDVVADAVETNKAVASICDTQKGYCKLGVGLGVGTPCDCSDTDDPILGVAR